MLMSTTDLMSTGHLHKQLDSEFSMSQKWYGVLVSVIPKFHMAVVLSCGEQGGWTVLKTPVGTLCVLPRRCHPGWADGWMPSGCVWSE